jgi:soluble lytic murein transglycosylase-like protein
MPETYNDMREAYGLGQDPYAPEDNIVAGTAYLRRLHARYGFPAMFAAYNDGPGNYERRMADGTSLPAETRNYVVEVAGSLERHHRHYRVYASAQCEHVPG